MKTPHLGTNVRYLQAIEEVAEVLRKRDEVNRYVDRPVVWTNIDDIAMTLNIVFPEVAPKDIVADIEELRYK